jgi:hypothetical protein
MWQISKLVCTTRALYYNWLNSVSSVNSVAGKVPDDVNDDVNGQENQQENHLHAVGPLEAVHNRHSSLEATTIITDVQPGACQLIAPQKLVGSY